MATVRGKSITQLLLLGAIDSIQVCIFGLWVMWYISGIFYQLMCLNWQKKYWDNLKAAQKIAIMDILLSLLEFAASYNSYSSLRTRMHHIPAER